MSLPAFASVDDYQAMFGSDDDVDRVQAVLNRASTMMRSVVNSAMVNDSNALDFTGAKPWAADTFVGICVQVAHRVIDNPDGLASETIAGYAYSQVNASSDAYITKQERAELVAVLGRARFPGIWTLPTTRAENDYPDVPWVGPALDTRIDVDGSDEPMPFTYDPLNA